MEEQLESFSFQIKEALKVKKRVDLKGVNQILILGIGGSGCAGELFKDFIKDKIDLPVVIVKNKLPFCDMKTFVFVVSYSGNTRETVKLYNEVRKKTKKIVILTSGGKLGKEKNVVKIPKGFAPRLSVAFMFSAMLILIRKKDLFKNFEFPEIDKNYAKKIAKSLKKKIPVIYAGSENLNALAYKWKINFNETSKVFSHSNFFTEIAHNEVEAILSKKFHVLILLEKNEKIIERFSKINKCEKINLKGKNEPERIFYGLLLGDYVACYLARLNKKNPLEIKRVNVLKK